MYESVIESTRRVLAGLPTPEPYDGILAGFGNEYTVPDQDMFLGDNYHYPMGSAYLKYGVIGIAEKAAKQAEAADSAEKKELLQGISIVYREIAAYFSRYAAALEAQAQNSGRLFTRTINNLTALSSRQPIHFEEALQLVYLMWKLRCLNSLGADIGRLDVHLFPFYEYDISAGYITEKEVLSLLCEFWNELNRNNSGDTLINVMVGGKNPDGSNAGSRLSVLMLKATKKCAKSEPHINVRVFPGLDPEIYKAMLEVQLMGQGQATVYNDEVVIPSLIAFGVPEEMAYCYTNDGCTEIMLDGYSGIEFNHIDAVAAFELAFNNGYWLDRPYRKPVKYWSKDNSELYYTPDAAPGYASGKADECRTFDELYQMFLSQYAFQIRNKANALKRREDERLAGGKASLLLNGTYDFVLDSGRDILRGGFPYTHYMMFSGSIPTAADCLTAIKRLVFDTGKYTVSEIRKALCADFEGYEIMRQEMLCCPKFGNDQDEVDLMAADIARHFCAELERFRAERGFAIAPALLGWRFLEEAYGVAATPDGRRYCDPIAEHYCATPGKALKGPTAIINSIAKARDVIARAVGVCAVQITLPRNLGNDDEQALTVIDSLVSAAMEGGLNEINIAIYDAELLREAQRDPLNHQDVIVRVWGYSARFVDLCKAMQDHVINRITGV